MSPQENKANSREAFLFGASVLETRARDLFRCPNSFAERDTRRRDSDIVQGSDGVFVWTKRVVTLVFVGFVIGHIMMPMVTTTYVDAERARLARIKVGSHGR